MQTLLALMRITQCYTTMNAIACSTVFDIHYNLLKKLFFSLNAYNAGLFLSGAWRLFRDGVASTRPY